VRLNGNEISSEPSSPAGGLVVQVGGGDIRIELMTADGRVLDSKASSATCVMGYWRNGVCDSFQYKRLDLVVEALRVMPFHALRDGIAIELLNKTGYEVKEGAAFPLSNCFVYSMLRVDDAPLVGCTTVETGNQLRVFPINPITLELMPEHVGGLPEGVIIDRPYGIFGDSPHAPFGVGSKGMYIDVSGYGVYYYTNQEPRKLLLTQDNFLTSSLVLESAGIRVLYSFFGTE
jgi:hypothetical protein